MKRPRPIIGESDGHSISSRCDVAYAANSTYGSDEAHRPFEPDNPDLANNAVDSDEGCSSDTPVEEFNATISPYEEDYQDEAHRSDQDNPSYQTARSVGGDSVYGADKSYGSSEGCTSSWRRSIQESATTKTSP